MIEDAAFVGIWMTLPFLWNYLLKTAGLSLRRLTIPGFVILAFYVFQYVGVPVLYLQLDEYRASFVHDRMLVIRVFSYTAVTMTLMMLGFIAGRSFLGPLDGYGAGEIKAGNRSQVACLVVLIGICFLVLLAYLSKVGSDKIALLGVMRLGDEVQVEVARSAMVNAFEGKYHRYDMFMNKLLLFCVYAVFAQCLLKPGRGNRVFFSVVFLIASFSMTMAIEKGPMANFLIALFLVYVLVKRDGVIPVRGAVLVCVVLLAVLVVFYMSFSNVGSPWKAVLSVASRAFTGQIQPACHYLQYFPHRHDFLLGSSFPNPGNILPFRHYPLTVEMMAWYNPAMSEMGVVGSMPTVYWGEMYANFGLPGVLLPPFFVGFVLYWLNRLALRLSPDPIAVALYVWMMMHFKNLSGSSLSGYFLDDYALVTLLSFFAIAFASGRGAVRLRDRLPRAEAAR